MPKLGFTVSPLTAAVAATQAKYEGNGIIEIWRIRADDIRAVGSFTESIFGGCNKDGYSLRCYVEGANYTLSAFSTNQGNLSVPPQLLSELPANGNDIVIYVEALTTGLTIAVGTPDGTFIHSGSNADANSKWVGGAGTGNIALGPASGDTIFHLDCYARLSAIRTGNARFAKPLTSDSDVLGVYYFGEGSGTTAADAETGTALTITNASWQAANGWEATGGALVANAIRFVPGSVPDPIVAGVSYTLEVEAIDTTQANARVTTYSDPTITIGIDVAVPVGYTISSGDVTQAMASGLATFPGIVFAAVAAPPAPVISSFLPTSGPVGTVVTFTGTGFTGLTAATINGVAMASVTVISPTSATAVVGGGSTTGATALTGPGGTGTGSNFTVTGVVIPPVPAVIVPSRFVKFTTVPVNQTSNVNFTTALIGQVTNRLGVVETSYVTPVTLIMQNGDGSIIGAAVVTPVAGIFTFPANSVGVRLLSAVESSVSVSIQNIDGASAPINIKVPAPTPSLIVALSLVPRSTYAEPEIVLNITGPVAGGTLFLEATFDETTWFAFDVTAYAGGAVANSFIAAFNGHAESNGVKAVRVRKSVQGVTYAGLSLNVAGL